MKGLVISGAVVFVAMALAACSGGVESGAGGATTTSSTSTGTGGATPAFPDDCQSNADCSSGTCQEVTAGGFKICLTPPPEAQGCSPTGPLPDQCCTSKDCQGGGKCYSSSNVPTCSGAVPAPYNYCVGNACQVDSDCQGAGVAQVCAPEGAFGQPTRTCVNAYCKADADCTAKAGGRCAPVMQSCCGTVSGLACVYEGGCRTDADCGNDGQSHCEIDPTSHEGTCAKGGAVCPA